MAVTNNIREIREQRGIYQDDLAAAIGFSTKTVGRIERGDSFGAVSDSSSKVILVNACKFRFIGSPIPLATDQCFRL